MRIRPLPLIAFALALAAGPAAQCQARAPVPDTFVFENQLRISRPVAIVANGGGTPSYKNDTWLGITGPDGAFTTLDIVAFESGAGVYPGLQLELYGCSKTKFCPVPRGKVVGAVSGNAWNGKGDTTDAGLLFRTTEDQTPTANGMGAELWYTPTGSTAFLEGMALNRGGLGGVTIGKPQGGSAGDAGAGTLNVQKAIYLDGEPVVVARAGHIQAPATKGPKACGGVAEGSTDNAGEVSNGSPVTSCALTFRTAWNRRPFCTATAQGPGAGEVWLTELGPGGFVFNSARAFAGAWTFTCL